MTDFNCGGASYWPGHSFVKPGILASCLVWIGLIRLPQEFMGKFFFLFNFLIFDF